MDVKDYIDIFDRVLDKMVRLSTWRFAAIWLIFFMFAVGYLLNALK